MLPRAERRTKGAANSSRPARAKAAATCLLACDLGGSKLHLAVANRAGGILAEVVEETDRRSARALLSQIRKGVATALAEAGIARRQVARAVIGMPGVIDPTTGRLSLCPNLPDFGRTNVAAAMSRAFGCSARIENDVNLAVLGERWRGAGRGKDNMAFIALGTGIGMGLLCDGHLMRGAHGAAAEIAYLPIGGDPFHRGNVAAGTLESIVGTPGILRRFAESGGKGAADVRGILAAMSAGDPIARRVIDDTAKWTALGIASVIALCDPELIVLGGGFGTRREVVARIRAHLRRCLTRPVPVVPSILGNRAALLGAIAIGLADLAPETPARARSRKVKAA